MILKKIFDDFEEDAGFCMILKKMILKGHAAGF